jgi:4,5-dihydroxyphthalate decarboxylase
MVHHTFDACEFPMATYLRTLETPERPYLAIPVFPSRHFRLSCLFVNADSAIVKPEDLVGKRIGISVFDMAAGVWLRGILHDHFGVDRHSPTYVIGGLEFPYAGDEHPQFYPEGFTFDFERETSLAQALAEGSIDAIVTARAPSTWTGAAGDRVRRLFEDPKAAELDYYLATGILPAMHVLAVKRPIAEAHPGLTDALLTAFTQAQEAARAQLWESAALDTMLPWQLEHLIETERLLGPDYWASGIEANRPMLDALIDYCLADGLISRRFTVEELF